MINSLSNRRDFLKKGILGVGGILALPSCLKNYTPWQFFTEEEAICVVSICEQIIPADEYGPGAAYAGVVYYIDKQLKEVFTWDREKYRKGIAAIQSCSNALYQKNFEDLGLTDQESFLVNMERNDIDKLSWTSDIDPSSLFRTMVQHTMQGFYGSPRHGGNRNYISYRLMKLDYPYIVGQNRYRDLDSLAKTTKYEQ